MLTDAGAPLTWTLNNHDAQRAVTRYGRADATDGAAGRGTTSCTPMRRSTWRWALRRRRGDDRVHRRRCPGSLYLYQGEELGLPEVLDIPADRREDPLFVRTNGKRDRPRRLPRAAAVERRPGHRRRLLAVDARTTVAAAAGGLGPLRGRATGRRSGVDARRCTGTAAASGARSTRGRRSSGCARQRELVAFRRGDVLVVLNVSDHRRRALPADLVGGDGRRGVVGARPRRRCRRARRRLRLAAPDR